MPKVTRRTLLAAGIVPAVGLARRTRGAAVTGESNTQGNPILGEGGGIHHVSIRTSDWSRTLKFYGEVLGFRVKLAWSERAGSMNERLSAKQARNQRWAYLDSGDGRYVEVFEDPSFVAPLSSGSDPTKHGDSALVHFAIRTSRIDELCNHARNLGATVLEDPSDFTIHTTTGQGPITARLFFLQGPNGEWIELIQNAP
jgi:catechol 2,3-dioxygenase-like lactoylglutathione lyase family enzyme